MLKPHSLAWLVLLVSGVLSCAADVAPTDTADHGPAPSPPPAEGQSFEVQLSCDVTAETVMPAIVAAGRAELAVACESMPGAALRILNPLASGSYEDVPCAAILEGEGTAETRAAPKSHADGPIGRAQQEIGPISLLACGLATVGTGLFTRYALCPHGRTEQDRTRCNDVGLWGGAGLTFVCTLPFLPIFF